jgi:hypothetical protein
MEAKVCRFIMIKSLSLGIPGAWLQLWSSCLVTSWTFAVGDGDVILGNNSMSVLTDLLGKCPLDEECLRQ